MALLHFSERLKQLRTERKLTQRQVAMMVGVTRSTLSTYENQARYPSYDILVSLSRVYSVTTDYLLGKEDRQYIDITGLTEEESAAIARWYICYRSPKSRRQHKKRIKQLAGAILVAAVVFSMSIYAYAEENPIPPSEESLPVATEQPSAPLTETPPPTIEETSSDPQEPTEGTSVIVNTLDELQAAIEAADDGDTIIIGGKILVLESVIIGSADKIISLTPNDNFSGNSMFSLYTDNNQAITFQNLILDGNCNEEKKVFAIIGAPFGNTDSQGMWSFDNVIFENFIHTMSTVIINNADAVFSNCCFKNNYGKRRH